MPDIVEKSSKITVSRTRRKTTKCPITTLMKWKASRWYREGLSVSWVKQFVFKTITLKCNIAIIYGLLLLGYVLVLKKEWIQNLGHWKESVYLYFR